MELKLDARSLKLPVKLARQERFIGSWDSFT
jgi:hypothetical protein